MQYFYYSSLYNMQERGCIIVCLLIHSRLLFCPQKLVPYLRMHTNTKHNNSVEKMIRLIPSAPIGGSFFAPP